MITAEQARQLAGPTIEEYVERLGPYIERVASTGNHQLRVGIDSNQDIGFWQKGANQHANWLEAKRLLEQLGYQVSFKYDHVHYTLIEW